MSAADQAIKASLEKLQKDNDTYGKTRSARNESVLVASMGSHASALQQAGRRERAEEIEASRRLFTTASSLRPRRNFRCPERSRKLL